jgi:hypothetical protein
MKHAAWSLAVALSLSALSATPVRAIEPARLVTAKHALHEAAFAKSIEPLVAARATFEQLLAQEPQSTTLLYWLALADHRLVPRLMSEDKKLAKRYSKDGIARLDQVLKAEPKHVEAMALKGAMVGMSIALSPMSAMSAGPESNELFEGAMALEPGNPRIHLMDGIGILNRPKFVGGGADKALPRLRKAQELFAAAPAADSTAIDWGRGESYLWAGRASLKLDDAPGAVEAFKKCLEFEPDNAWVRFELLPKAEQLAAQQAKS